MNTQDQTHRPFFRKTLYELKILSAEVDLPHGTILNIIDELSFRRTQAADQFRKQLALKFKIRGEIKRKNPKSNTRIADRRYKNRSLEDMEELFYRNKGKPSKNGRRTIKYILHELEYRNTKRSRYLKNEITIYTTLNAPGIILTPKEKELVRLRELGSSVEELRLRFNLSRQKVNQIFHKLQSLGKWGDDDIKSIEDELKMADLKTQLSLLTKATKKNIFDDYKSGHSDSLLIKNHNLSKKILSLLIENEIQIGKLNRRLKILNLKKYKKNTELYIDIERMVKAGYSREKIASILGVTTSMVSIHFSVMANRNFYVSSKYRGFYDIDLIEYRSKIITQMNNNKFTKKQIASELGISVHGVQRHINLHLVKY